MIFILCYNCDSANIKECGWVSDYSIILGSVCVYGNSWIYGNAKVYDNAEIWGNVKVYGNTAICGNYTTHK